MHLFSKLWTIWITNCGDIRGESQKWQTLERFFESLYIPSKTKCLRVGGIGREFQVTMAVPWRMGLVWHSWCTSQSGTRRRCMYVHLYIILSIAQLMSHKQQYLEQVGVTLADNLTFTPTQYRQCYAPIAIEDRMFKNGKAHYTKWCTIGHQVSAVECNFFFLTIFPSMNEQRSLQMRGTRKMSLCGGNFSAIQV